MKKVAHIIVTALLLLGGGSPLQAQKKMLSLADALERAGKGNKALQVQILEEIHSAEQTREAKGAHLPNISANVAYSYFFDRQIIFLPGSFAGTNKPVQEVAVGGKNTYNGFVSLYQPILTPGIRRQTKAALISEKIQREKTTDYKSQVALQVSIRYFDILMMTGQLDLLEQSLQRNVRALKDARSLFFQGRALKSDTLRSFIAVENLKSSASYMKNSIAVSGMELKRLIGIEDTDEIALSGKLDFDTLVSQSDFYSIAEALKTAEANRKDLNIQKLAIGLQQKRLEIARAELMPRLSLIGQYQVQAQADNMRLGDYAWPRTSFLGAQLSIPIFNGNRTRSQISQANIRLQQEQIRLNDFKDEIKTQLATIISKWKEALSQLMIQQTTVSSAELNYQMNEDRFKSGLASRLELTDAELALTQARINHLRATYNLRVLHTELQHALGLLSL